MGHVEMIVRHLFPVHREVNFACVHGSRFLSFSEGKLELAFRKLKSNKSPGPGLIPSEVVKSVAIY